MWAREIRLYISLPRNCKKASSLRADQIAKHLSRDSDFALDCRPSFYSSTKEADKETLLCKANAQDAVPHLIL